MAEGEQAQPLSEGFAGEPLLQAEVNDLLFVLRRRKRATVLGWDGHRWAVCWA